MDARVTDMAAIARIQAQRAMSRLADMEAAIAANHEAERIRMESAKMGQFITRKAAGLPLRREADRHCEEVLATLATKDGQESLQILLTKTSRA